MNVLNKLFRVAHAEQGSGLTFPNQSSRFDPYKSFRYSVQIKAGASSTFAKAGFQKVTGLKMKVDTIEYREGGDSLTVIKTPGLVKFDPITLERGMSADSDMWNWAVDSIRMKDGSARGSMIVSLFDRDGTTVVKKWNVFSCWVSEYETGDFDAMGNNVMVDRIVVQHEGFESVAVR